jgi:hypothetical protein
VVGVEQWAEIRRLYRVERVSIREISRRMGLHRKTEVRRTFQRTVYRPGELVQCDLWEPRELIAVGHGQQRRGYVVTAELCWSRLVAGALIFSKEPADILWGLGRCHTSFSGNTPIRSKHGTGKTHLSIAVSIRACLAGQRVQFATATEWVARLSDAKRHGNLEAELRRLSFIPLIVVDEVGYIPFDPEAANLMFSLVSSRYERASMIVTSNKPFSAWGEIFGDDMAATAMIDRLIHHAEILSLKGDSYRLRGKQDARPTG